MDKYENKINANLMMFETLVDLKGAMDGFGTNQKSVDIKDIFGRFRTDLISSVSFELECDTIKMHCLENKKDLSSPYKWSYPINC
ncbi:hypothetical protein BDFB_012949 [Asbolus verrucosus]|uniref:Uncharacterized protein n=1 Tax=Asbolus verrucosus TaxID=1661398 RepID=A0A482VTL0_ASBVE|nr:hypothetical protein BDFB_012949 [Asbolus verrucosus]